MWIFCAVLSAVLWGISFAASGRLFERGFSPMALLFTYCVVGVGATAIYYALAGGIPRVVAESSKISADVPWLVLAVGASIAAALLNYVAIGEKNSTAASFVVISYPIFVAVFAWVFFRQIQFNLSSVSGAGFILAGLTIFYLGNR